jgi:quinoprotein dehydrogenase-associated probable ABC transporter substrate-binding protein/PQQ-dependent catabolism-associated CXXCW motif protein
MPVRKSLFRLVTVWLPAALALVIAAGAPVTASAEPARSELVDRSALRVCADPNNLPYSNDKGEGFENKIAEIIADELDVPVEYTFFPQTIGFVRNTLGANRCDLIIGVATTSELVQGTNPYYRSTYVIVHRPDIRLSSDALDDPFLRTLRIGIQPQTPPATMVARLGLLDNVTTYRLVVDTRLEKPARDMVRDVADGKIDVALTWGPLAGYWAKQIDPSLVFEPLKSGPSIERTEYMMSMGIRRGEPDWKHELNEILKKRESDIRAILLDYGDPLLDNKADLIKPEKKTEAAPAAVVEPAGYRMDDYHAPVPKTLSGARTVDIRELRKLASDADTVLIDVSPAPRKPENRPAGAVWKEPKRDTIRGAVWLANMGLGKLPQPDETAFKTELEKLAGPDESNTLVFFCKPDCWMSWNAAKRALSYGFKNVVWFPEGAEAWVAAGLPEETISPWRP